jgi:hypothetical protein
MLGFLGTTSLAMRWAMTELDVRLWTLSEPDPDDATRKRFIGALAPAPIPADNTGLRVLALAQAEQVTEVERKIQILEGAWEPWLEGIAVFGELAADPRQDQHVRTQIAQVIAHLWDRSVWKLAEEQNSSPQEAARREYVEAESLYAEAMKRDGRPRLRTYLVRDHRKYLAGYLAARSIVAAWRSTLDRSLSGAEAFRLLLHVTRYSSYDELPDSGLPLAEFTEAVITHQTTWLRAVAEISGEDLERVLLEFDSPFSWEGGRLQAVGWHQANERTLDDRLTDVARQAVTSLRGERASPARVPNANELCLKLMDVAANALTNASPDPGLFNSRTMHAILPRLVILPLGRANCPFWYIVQDRRLNCLIRTREKDRETGTPSYDMISFPLDEEQSQTLIDRIRRSGSNRMTVTRVADLAEGQEDREPGMNYLAFEYEGWIHVQPRGMLFGGTEVDPSLYDAIAERLTPNPLIAFQEALTGNDHPCARRTKTWIDSLDWTIDLSGTDVDLEPWALRVKSVAEEVLSNPTLDESTEHSRRLLQFVLDDYARADAIAVRGLSALAEDGVSELSTFLRFLDASGRGPVADDPSLADLCETVESILAPLMEHSRHGWDVVRPAVLREGVAR